MVQPTDLGTLHWLRVMKHMRQKCIDVSDLNAVTASLWPMADELIKAPLTLQLHGFDQCPEAFQTLNDKQFVASLLGLERVELKFLFFVGENVRASCQKLISCFLLLTVLEKEFLEV